MADNPAASRDVAAQLRKLDLDVQLCFFDGRTLAATPVRPPDAVLCHLTDYVERAPEIAKVIKAHFAPRQLPIIGALSRPTPLSEHFDSTLYAPMHPSQIANRVNSMIRLGVMESEISRRIATLREDFGLTPELGDLSVQRRFRVLFIGKATPAFMVIINALQNKGVEIVAAFTSFSAFDYLHGEPFDAVVMNALEQAEPALTISETMQRNAKLYHVPTLFLVDNMQDSVFHKTHQTGSRDLIDIDAPAEEIRGRILELANYHRVHEQLKTEIFGLVGPECRDESDTVFSRRFFDAHLPRMVADAETSGQHVTLLALRVRPHATEPVEADFLQSAIVQTGAMIRNLIRMQDVVCRYEEDVFTLAFYDTTLAEGEIILARLKDLIDCAAYDGGIGRVAALNMSVESAIVQSDLRGSDAERLIADLLSELNQNAV